MITEVRRVAKEEGTGGGLSPRSTQINSFWSHMPFLILCFKLQNYPVSYYIYVEKGNHSTTFDFIKWHI